MQVLVTYYTVYNSSDLHACIYTPHNKKILNLILIIQDTQVIRFRHIEFMSKLISKMSYLIKIYSHIILINAINPWINWKQR